MVLKWLPNLTTHQTSVIQLKPLLILRNLETPVIELKLLPALTHRQISVIELKSLLILTNRQT